MNEKLLENCCMMQKLIVFKGKVFIINYPDDDILSNKRSELINKFRHENMTMLANIGNSRELNNNSND